MPIYNVEPYIRKCIDSILIQTFTEFELILVNDGSSDNCGEICDEYKKGDERIKVIHKKNGGISSARNAGLKIVRGDYVGFVDSDDYIADVMYEELFTQAKLFSADIVVCGFSMVDVEGVLVNDSQKDTNNLETRQLSNVEALTEVFNTEKDFDLGTEVNPKWIIMCNKLFNKNLFDDLKFTEGMIYEDELIAHELLFNSRKVIDVPEKYYYYVQRKNSLSNFNFSMKKFDRVYALKKRADFLRLKGLPNLHYQAMKGYMDAFFWNYYVANSTLTSANKELKKVKRTFDKSFVLFVKNPLISWKQKIFICLFILYPQVLLYNKKKKVSPS